jgi:hypothetical protein
VQNLLQSAPTLINHESGLHVRRMETFRDFLASTL